MSSSNDDDEDGGGAAGGLQLALRTGDRIVVPVRRSRRRALLDEDHDDDDDDGGQRDDDAPRRKAHVRPARSTTATASGASTVGLLSVVALVTCAVTAGAFVWAIGVEARLTGAAASTALVASTPCTMAASMAERACATLVDTDAGRTACDAMVAATHETCRSVGRDRPPTLPPE